MKSFQLTRLNVSSYQDPLFLEKEKQSLQSLGLRYCRERQELDESPLILLTNTHTQLSLYPELLAKTTLIIHPNSGYDNLSADYPLIQHIPTIIGHEIRAQAVAEWSLSCFFEASIKRPTHSQWDQSRKWDRTRLKDKEVVIFGHGHIGKLVKQSLEALGVKIHLLDPYLPYTHQHFSDLPAKRYHALIACCGLNEANKMMFNKDLFSHLSFDIFINGARGGLVNEKDLQDYLIRNPQTSVYLDVFQQEPFGKEWQSFPQVTCSSHIAGVYKELDQEIINFEYRVLEDFLHSSAEDFLKKYQHQLLSSKLKEGVII